jgi:hypothetical protein
MRQAAGRIMKKKIVLFFAVTHDAPVGRCHGRLRPHMRGKGSELILSRKCCNLGRRTRLEIWLWMHITEILLLPEAATCFPEACLPAPAASIAWAWL